jgi:hypothetical protein
MVIVYILMTKWSTLVDNQGKMQRSSKKQPKDQIEMCNQVKSTDKNQTRNKNEGKHQRTKRQKWNFQETHKNNTKISLKDSPLLRKTPEKQHIDITHTITTSPQNPRKANQQHT